MRGWSGRAAAGDAVGLLDEHDVQALRASRLSRGQEIRRFHASTGPMAEDEGSWGALDCMQMSAGGSFRCCDLHAGDV